MIDLDAVPLAVENVIVRPDPGGRMLFQIRTDEMYLAGDAAYAAFALCDGTRTVAEIADTLLSANPDWRADGRDQVVNLIADLASRQLVELWIDR